jgi:hypothetical protein
MALSTRWRRSTDGSEIADPGDWLRPTNPFGWSSILAVLIIPLVSTRRCVDLSGEKIIVSKVTKMKPSAKATSKPATKPKPKGKAVMTKEGEAYKGHKIGSRKATIHQLFDTEGREVAWTRGIKLGLSENSLRSWFGFWSRESGASTKKPKVAKVKTKTNGSEATANA